MNSRIALRKLSLLASAAGCLLAIGVMAAPAQAAHTFASDAAHWRVEGRPISTGEPLNCAAVGSTNLKFWIGETLTPLELTAGNISCESTALLAGGTTAKATGFLRFKELAVTGSVGCTIKGGEFKTYEVEFELGKVDGGAQEFMRIKPVASANTFATITVQSCALANTYPIKGVIYGAVNALGVETAAQPASFSQTGPSELTLGKNPGQISGSWSLTLPSHPGAAWGAS